MSNQQMFFEGELEGCKLSLFQYGNSFKNCVAVAVVSSIEVREEWQIVSGDLQIPYHLENLLARAKDSSFAATRQAVAHLRTLVNQAKAAAPSFAVEETKVEETVEG